MSANYTVLNHQEPLFHGISLRVKQYNLRGRHCQASYQWHPRGYLLAYGNCFQGMLAMSFGPLKPQFDRDGYVVVRQLMPQGEFAELKRELDRYIRDVVPGLPPTDAFYDVDRSQPESLKQLHRLHQDAALRGILHASCLAGLAEVLLGETATAESPEWFNKPPLVRNGTPPHQDNYYFNLKPCSVATLWMALDRVDDENACMRTCPDRTTDRCGRMHARRCWDSRKALPTMVRTTLLARWPFIWSRATPRCITAT